MSISPLGPKLNSRFPPIFWNNQVILHWEEYFFFNLSLGHYLQIYQKKEKIRNMKFFFLFLHFNHVIMCIFCGFHRGNNLFSKLDTPALLNFYKKKKKKNWVVQQKQNSMFFCFDNEFIFILSFLLNFNIFVCVSDEFSFAASWYRQINQIWSKYDPSFQCFQNILLYLNLF